MKDFIGVLLKSICAVLILIALLVLIPLVSIYIVKILGYSTDKPEYSNISSAANVETIKIGKINMPAVGNNEIYQITLEDGTVCLILLGGYRGGISCNWEAEEIGCSTEEMGYGEPEEDHNLPFILEDQNMPLILYGDSLEQTEEIELENQKKTIIPFILQ